MSKDEIKRTIKLPHGDPLHNIVRQLYHVGSFLVRRQPRRDEFIQYEVTARPIMCTEKHTDRREPLRSISIAMGMGIRWHIIIFDRAEKESDGVIETIVCRFLCGPYGWEGVGRDGSWGGGVVGLLGM